MAKTILDGLPLRRAAAFMRVPGPAERANSRVGVVGIPFDCGAHPVRVGARLGPTAIREQSQLLRPFNPPDFDFDPLAKLEVADWGDVDVVPGQIEDAFDKIERVIGAVLDSGALPLTMGGDGAGTLPQIRAVHKKFPDLVTLHIDSHDNAVECKTCLFIDSDNNIIVSDDPEHLVSTIGVSDMIIVHTKDITMVCPKTEAQRVKDLVGRAKEKYGDRYQ